jgi:hypothetical protein
MDVRRLAIALALTLTSFTLTWLTPASAAESPRCLSRDQQRTAIAEGKAVSLATALKTLRHRVPGEVIGARLCQEPGRMVYKLTVLARDGKVKRATIDAANGTLVER